jgi:hypothetical protein
LTRLPVTEIVLSRRMKRLSLIVLGSTLLTALVGGTAQGQKTYAIALGGGAAIPVGKLGDTQKTGYNAIVALAIGVAELPIGVRFDAIYNNILAPSKVSAVATPSDLRVSGVLANLVFAFPGTNAKAYILAGAGLYNSKPDVGDVKAQNNIGFNAGFGSTFGAGSFALFIESRYHSVSRTEAKGGVYQFVPITLGILF